MRWFHYVLIVVALVVGLATGFVVGYGQAPGNCILPLETYGENDVPDGFLAFPRCDDIRPDLANPL